MDLKAIIGFFRRSYVPFLCEGKRDPSLSSPSSHALKISSYISIVMHIEVYILRLSNSSTFMALAVMIFPIPSFMTITLTGVSFGESEY